MVLTQLQAAEDVQYPFKSQKQQVFPRVFGSDREIGGSIECTDKITIPHPPFTGPVSQVSIDL